MVNGGILNGEILNVLLRDLSEQFNFGVIFIRNDEEFKDYKKRNHGTSSSLFCQEVSKHEKCYNSCYEDHKKRAFGINEEDKRPFCHAGLYNRSFPIMVDGEEIAYLLVGQILIKERIEESIEIFNKFINEKNTKLELLNIYKLLFNKIRVVSLQDFNSYCENQVRLVVRLLVHLLYEDKRNRDRMVSTAHELFLPIQTLIIEAENLKEECHNKEKDFDFIMDSSAKILLEVNYLSLHVNNLQRILRSPVLRSKYEFINAQIFPVIEQTRIRFWLEAERKRLYIHPISCTTGKFPKIPMIKDELSLALGNIYSNAIKYSYIAPANSNRHRYITTECDYVNIKGIEYFKISISNFGVPILQYEIDNGLIFQRGYRGKKSLDRNRTGSGVGLFLIKDIIETLHKGIIELTSEDMKSGNLTTVSIFLPTK